MIFLVTSEGSIKKVSFFESTNTGVPPAKMIAFAHITGVSEGTRTSSFFFKPIAQNAACKADVHELVVIEYFLLWYLLHFFSSNKL